MRWPGSGLALAAVVVLIAGCSGKKASNEVLAEINGKPVRAQEYIERYKDFKKKSPVEPNGNVRRGLLQAIVDDKILVLEARKQGLDADSLARFEKLRIRMQEILNRYNKQVVVGELNPSEDELKRMYYDYNTRINARHLFARTREQADSLFEALQNGESFEVLAKGVFKDPRLRDNGGALGFFSVNEMDPAFEVAAYGLETGEISHPVKTKNGYSIIRVDERKRKPFLTEYDYSTNKEEVEKYLKLRTAKLKVRSFVENKRKSLQITFNERLLDEVRQLFSAGQIFEPLPEKGTTLPTGTLVTFKGGQWDAATLLQKAAFTSEQQRSWVHDRQSLKDYIAGLVVRQQILKDAADRDLDKGPDFTRTVNRKFENFLMERMSAVLATGMTVSDDSLFAWYKNHEAQYAAPAMVNLRQIIVHDEQLAAEVEKRLKAGADFSDLARRYSDDRNSAARGGETGFLQHRDMGPWAKLAFALKKDEWAGPLKIKEGQLFIQLIEKTAARPRRFEEVKNEVEFAVKSAAWQDYRRARLDSIKKHLEIRLYPQKLRDIKLN